MKSPGVAAVLSFFITGLGQIYNGRIFKGLVFIVIQTINLALMMAAIGFITAPIFWIYGIYDAYNEANEINRGLAPSGEGPAPGTAPGMKKCPFCAEDIKAEAVVCKHCGKDIPGEGETKPPTLGS